MNGQIRHIAGLLGGAFLFGLLLFSPARAMAADVEVNETNFPDPAFRQWVIDHCSNGDTILTEEEIRAVRTISFVEEIQDLKGVEKFTNLESLRFWRNKVTSLPELPGSLRELHCSDNQLTSLPELPSSLTSLDCGNNQLTSLPELPSCLSRLGCGKKQVTRLPEMP